MTKVVELFRIETKNVALSISGPAQRRALEYDLVGRSQAAPVSAATGSVRILPRRPGLELEPGTHRLGVPDQAARDIAQHAGPPLFEETTYSVLLESRTDHPVEVRHRDPLLLRGIQPSREHRLWHGTLNFGSQVGISRFSVYVHGRPEFDLEVEVQPSKLDYRADYASMIGDVQDIATGLALEYLRATHQLGSVASEKGSRLDWIALLRHLIDELENAVRFIAQHPIRALHRNPQLVRVEALRHSDSTVRRAVRLGAGRGPLVRLKSGLQVRRYLPERRPEPTLDIPEHRWLATQLAQVRMRLASIIQEEKDRHRSLQRAPRFAGALSKRDIQSLAELEVLELRVALLEKVEPLAAAQGPPPAGFTSLQLQGAPGYREAYRALIILGQGLRIHGDAVELSVKDIHRLYEYWCFLALVRMVSEILNTPIPADQLLEVQSEGLRVRLKQGWTQSVPFVLPGNRTLQVVYNPSFHDPESLLSQKPDLALTFSDPHWPTVRLVLDAKYRVENDPDFVSRFGAPGPPPDAVNVLHRYRDAILESEAGLGRSNRNEASRPRRTVVEGAALYPLSAERASSFEGTRYWRSLQRLGIGALPFLPGSTAWVERWLRTVLHRSGWAVADAVISHSTDVAHGHWKRAAEIPVLVGVLRNVSTAEHLDWIRQNREYYTPLTPSQTRQLRVGRVAIYEPAILQAPGEPGQIRLVAPVREIQVVRRSEIITPWPTRRDHDEYYVVYKLGEFQHLEMPVINRFASGPGQRFSTNRWTSALGLERARDTTELLLESAAEWQVYDALEAQGIQFTLKAATNPGERAGVEGRAWFVTEHGKFRLVSPGVVEVHRPNAVETVHPSQLLSLLT